MTVGANKFGTKPAPRLTTQPERNHDYKQLPALVHGAGDHWMVGVLHGRCAWVVLEEREGKAASSSHQQPAKWPCAKA